MGCMCSKEAPQVDKPEGKVVSTVQIGEKTLETPLQGIIDKEIEGEPYSDEDDTDVKS